MFANFNEYFWSCVFFQWNEFGLEMMYEFMRICVRLEIANNLNICKINESNQKLAIE